MKKSIITTIIIFAMIITTSVLAISCGKKASEETAEAEKTPEAEDLVEAEKIPILTYHKIVPADEEFETSLLIAEDTFDEQMKYLKDNGYTTLTPDEFYAWYNGGGTAPEKSVLITFDDGYYGTFYLAYPIIKKYGLAATVFCMGHHIEDTTHAWDPNAEKDYYIGMDVIEKLRKEYPRFNFESHTYDMHRKVDGKHPVDVYTYEQMVEDIKKMEPYGFTFLAYPWGDYNETMQKALKDNGYKMAFVYGDNYYAVRQDDQYAVHRIKISGKIDMDDFKKIVSLKSEDHNNPAFE